MAESQEAAVSLHEAMLHGIQIERDDVVELLRAMADIMDRETRALPWYSSRRRRRNMLTTSVLREAAKIIGRRHRQPDV